MSGTPQRQADAACVAPGVRPAAALGWRQDVTGEQMLPFPDLPESASAGGRPRVREGDAGPWVPVLAVRDLIFTEIFRIESAADELRVSDPRYAYRDVLVVLDRLDVAVCLWVVEGDVEASVSVSARVLRDLILAEMKRAEEHGGTRRVAQVHVLVVLDRLDTALGRLAYGERPR